MTGRPRVWQQNVGIMDGVGVLELSHPDGRRATHYFDPDRLDEVAELNWHGSDGYAKTWRGPLRTTLQQLMLDFEGSSRAVMVDHLNRNTFDSRSSNLAIKTVRGNQHNRSDQSKHGANIKRGFGKNSVNPTYEVTMYIGGRFVYRPGFKNLESAQQCRAVFLSIAFSVDAGERDVPTREELVAIARRFR